MRVLFLFGVKPHPNKFALANLFAPLHCHGEGDNIRIRHYCIALSL
ncbi:MAG: hypothetical protein JWO03_2066 [Bacteroidetes bacterium]|nr:hypothetical protein [Bacteroidota bacterium]